MGDGVFVVSGHFSRPTGDCTMLALNDNGTPVRFSERHITQQSFREDIGVAPYAATYRVVVMCAGITVGDAVVRYGLDVGPGKEISLGELAP